MDGDPRLMIAEGGQRPCKRNVSMLQEIRAERNSKIDLMHGAIADLGERLGVPVSLNRTIWALIKGLEHSWTEPA